MADETSRQRDICLLNSRKRLQLEVLTFILKFSVFTFNLKVFNGDYLNLILLSLHLIASLGLVSKMTPYLWTSLHMHPFVRLRLQNLYTAFSQM